MFQPVQHSSVVVSYVQYINIGSTRFSSSSINNVIMQKKKCAFTKQFFYDIKTERKSLTNQQYAGTYQRKAECNKDRVVVHLLKLTYKKNYANQISP